MSSHPLNQHWWTAHQTISPSFSVPCLAKVTGLQLKLICWATSVSLIGKTDAVSVEFLYWQKVLLKKGGFFSQKVTIESWILCLTTAWLGTLQQTCFRSTFALFLNKSLMVQCPANMVANTERYKAFSKGRWHTLSCSFTWLLIHKLSFCAGSNVGTWKAELRLQ